MQEMVLNHASVFVPHKDSNAIAEWLNDLAAGMAMLIQAGVVKKHWRMSRHPHSTPCLPDYSLYDACLSLRVRGNVDEYKFLMGLATKLPLLDGVKQSVANRFQSCEEVELESGQGEPIVLCAVVDGVAVGFPSEPHWDKDRLEIHFIELLPNGEIEPAAEYVDQLTRAVHARAISDRYRRKLVAGVDASTLWENRETAFPNLVLGPEIEAHLRRSSGSLSTIVGKLQDLDSSAYEWKEAGGPAPSWRTKVSPESAVRMTNKTFRDSRTFLSQSGSREVFEWHARFGNSGRIHLRFDSATREVEVGYIGPHL